MTETATTRTATPATSTGTGTPTLDGIHHLKIPVADLAENLQWWERVFGAERQAHWDHLRPDGTLFAYILMLPGLDVPVELRLDPDAAAGTRGFDPVNYAVATHQDLQTWAEHLDRVGAAHSPVLRGLIGWLLVVPSPAGLSIRLYARETHEFDAANADTDSPWLRPPTA